MAAVLAVAAVLLVTVGGGWGLPRVGVPAIVSRWIPPNGALARAPTGVGQLARSLLARTVLPGGARPQVGEIAAGLGTPPQWTATANFLDLVRVWSVPASAGTVVSAMRSERPRGGIVAGTGTSSAPGRAPVVSVLWAFPADVQQAVTAQLLLSAVALGAHRAELRADAQVVWRPRRPRIERVPATAHAVRITVEVLGSKRSPWWTGVITGSAIVARLRSLVNRLATAVPGLPGCDRVAGWVTLAFARSARAPALLSLREDPACHEATVTIGRRRLDALVDPAGRLARTVMVAAGLNPVWLGF